MREELQGLLLGYIREQNPVLLKQLQEDDSLHAFVMDKIAEVESVLISKPDTTEVEYLKLLTSDLDPVRYRFVRDLFETEFTDMCDLMRSAGTLPYELLDMVAACHHLFEEMPLVDGMDNPELDHAVACVIAEYLQL
ncbi:MAG: hypothetical protein V4557_12845 [Bacteroidota bacterium]